MLEAFTSTDWGDVLNQFLEGFFEEPSGCQHTAWQRPINLMIASWMEMLLLSEPKQSILPGLLLP